MNKAALVLILGTALVATGCKVDEDTNENVNYTDWGDDLPEAGNPIADCPVPDDAMEAEVSMPDHVIGDGTPQSCTSAVVVAAIAQGGVITFNCGPEPVTIVMQETAKIFNNTGPNIVIDGGSKVILSGGNARRILYMNTCDPDLVWTTDHCNDQDHPQLTVQNLTFADANSKGEPEETAGGGAIWVRGGRFKAVNCRFFRNTCADTGPDVGGAGIRVFDQYQDAPVYVVHSTFGGSADLGNVCSNGGAVSSIGVSWTILNSVFTDNRAIGNGGNPAESGTPGGGSGGAIYNDGNTMTLSLCGVDIERNEVNAHGAAIFFVSNNHDGTINIEDSVIKGNLNHSNNTWQILPGISGHSDTRLNVDDESTIE
ncbi:MAG: hypothetical protein MUC50_19810 [Myxococcota bacterium]|jgi:hypothetical protein|nr:hypothetical protein [Myxococcota bacterium]